MSGRTWLDLVSGMDEPRSISDAIREDRVDAEEASGFGPPPLHMNRQILDLFEYWVSKKDGRDIPDRRDLDPLTEIPRLLANVWLLDIEEDPRQYRYRLLGSSLGRAGPKARPGSLLQDGEEDGDIRQVFDALNHACAERLPFWRLGPPLMSHDRLVTRVETISLPLTVDRSENVRQLMNISIYKWLS